MTSMAMPVELFGQPEDDLLALYTGQPIVHLTPSQHAVFLEAVEDGASSVQIAARLHLSQHTVKSHLKAIMAATGSANRAGLAIGWLRGRFAIGVVNGRYGPRNPPADPPRVPVARVPTKRAAVTHGVGPQWTTCCILPTEDLPAADRITRDSGAVTCPGRAVGR